MCFSAQIEESHAKYLRMTGAEMDLEQFMEIFGLRVRDSSIKIPRAVDRWFEHPKGAAELELRNLIMAHRAARIAELEADIVEQQAKLAEAEAKLLVKPTKTAANQKRVSTNKLATFEKRRPLLQNWQPTALDDRIFPMQYAPIVMQVEGTPKIRLARYHCRQNGMPASIDKTKDGLYNARRDNITRWWRNEFGQSHALMLVRTFYENVEQSDGRNAVLHFIPEPGDLMIVACVYSVWKDPEGGRDLLSFAAVTDEPPAEIAAAGHNRVIINIKPENVGAWLTPEGRSDEELEAILSDKQQPYYGHEVVAAYA